MPRAGQPVAKLTCAGPGCRKRFAPVRSTARFCSTACSQRARRGTRKPATAKAPAAPAAPPKDASEKVPKRQTAPARSTAAADSHKLVVALRQELEIAGAEDTFEGQLALELARRLVTPGEGASSLADKVRAARAAALGSVKPTDTGGGDDDSKPPTEDEVDKARKAKEAKAAAAARAAEA